MFFVEHQHWHVDYTELFTELNNTQFRYISGRHVWNTH